jgi:hypothetical protein
MEMNQQDGDKKDSDTGVELTTLDNVVLNFRDTVLVSVSSLRGARLRLKQEWAMQHSPHNVRLRHI